MRKGYYRHEVFEYRNGRMFGPIKRYKSDEGMSNYLERCAMTIPEAKLYVTIDGEWHKVRLYREVGPNEELKRWEWKLEKSEGVYEDQ